MTVECPDAEQSLLDALVTGEADFGDVRGLGLKAGDFNSETHRLIFRAMESLYDRGEPIDSLSLHIELSGIDRPDGESWGQYIASVLGLALPIGDVDYAVRKIKERSRLRKIEEQAYRLYEAAKKGDVQGVQRLSEKVSELQCRDTKTGSRLKPVSAADLPDIEPPESLWGGLLFPGCITQLNAEPGTGKTTIAYNIAGLGAQGEAFVNEPFSKPIKTLYLDLETPVWLRPLKIQNICVERPKDFDLLDDLILSRDIGDLVLLCKAEKYDLVILDTQSRALGLQDENDNSENNRAAALLTRLVKETGAAVLLIHHTSKSGNSKDVYRGRGASALAGSVDIVANLEALDPDTVKVSVAKSRVPAELSSITMKKLGGDRFERVAIEETNTRLEFYRVQDFIVDLLSDGMKWRTSEIQERAEREGFTKRTVERAIKRLREAGKIYQVRQGVYALSGEVLNTDTAPNNYPEVIAP